MGLEEDEGAGAVAAISGFGEDAAGARRHDAAVVRPAAPGFPATGLRAMPMGLGYHEEGP